MTLQEIKRIGEFDCSIHHLNIMCAKINHKPHMVYELIKEYGSYTDSYTRESIFNYIADKYHNGDYNKVYNKWLYHDKFLAYDNGTLTKNELNKFLKGVTK